ICQWSWKNANQHIEPTRILKHLELAKFNFNDCDCKWLKKCQKLTEFAMTNLQTQVIDILGLEYEFYRLKYQKILKLRLYIGILINR
ncbi:15929_t:CDS:1, partial [Gigaspora rosea]